MESKTTVRMENYGELIPLVGNARALQLQAISRSLHRLDEHACNYGLSGRQEKRESSLEHKAQLIAKGNNLWAYHQGDPRGWSLYLVSEAQLGEESINTAYTNGLAVCPF